MNHTEIVKKLIGEIQPTGDQAIDDKRFENLKEMCKLVNDLVIEIDIVAYENKYKDEESMRLMGEYADYFISKTLGVLE